MKFIIDLWHERKVIWRLAINDCKAKFASSGLGVVWVFLQPLMTILVTWFVFQVGFRTTPIEDTPFIVWYIPAYLSWTFFSEGLVQVTNSLLEYRYLVKKVNFKVSVIPMIKVISSAFIHAAFIFFIIAINIFYDRVPTIYYIQCLYYFLCMIVLLVGLGWLLSVINAIINDVANIVNIVVQIGFWATPLFWDPEGMTSGLGVTVRTILKINPMYYICTGYRDSFINNVWFWEKPLYTLYFWGITLVLTIWGIQMFRKMRPQLDDVL